MPTENRCNTEMPAKLSPCPFCGQQDAFVEQLDRDASVVICQGRIDEHSACLARGPVGVQQHECEDQPGHHQALEEWNKRAAAVPHPDPIAWMVGTAFWWTKEEAEKDAAATRLPIVPVGPLSGGVEAEQLREVIKHSDAQIMRQSMRISNQRAQLAEAQALLRTQDELLSQAYQRDIGTLLKREIREISSALSASAEPSAPKCGHQLKCARFENGEIVDYVCQNCRQVLPRVKTSAPTDCAICRDLGSQCDECEEGEFREWADRHFAAADYRKTDAGVFIQDWMRHSYGAWCARGALARKQ